MEVGERLRLARNLKDISQESLAKKLKVSRGVIANIERGRTSPQPLVAGAICEILQIRSEWLLEGEEPMEDFGTVKRVTRVLGEIAESARLLTPAEQEYVLAMIKTYQAHRAPMKADAMQTEKQDLPREDE